MATIDTGVKELSTKLQQVGPVATAAMNRWYVTPQIADAIAGLANKIIELGAAILDKIVELLEGVAAPVTMFFTAVDWQDLRGMASTVSGEVKPEALKVNRVWHGRAADAYAKQVNPQVAAAARVASMADKIALTLGASALAGLAFYVALGLILAKFIVATIAALTALGSVVFSWAGAALIVEEAAVNTGLIIAAVTTLTSVLGTQAVQMVILHGEAVDNGTFPGGHWPNAAPGHFSDATVRDGDADWSLQS
jgi:hypothetical protein